MEQNEILEGNRLIAEFMGSKRQPEGDIGEEVEYHYFDGIGTRGGYLRNFSYHESWDWLMPVVEKISRIPTPGATLNCETHFPRTFGMIADNGQIMVRINCCPVILADTLIEACWLAVVDFIKWYNSQPS